MPRQLYRHVFQQLLHYVAKVGPRAETEENDVGKEVMLLSCMLSRDGRLFLKERRLWEHLYNVHSYSETSSVIQKFMNVYVDLSMLSAPL